MREQMQMINIKNIIPHPENPRKDLGDLEELTESIRKNGIMQNLTVVPVEDHPDQYMALIGHRRLAAAKAAGLTEVPAKVVTDLTLREQVGIMLEENMQRNDLTIVEQAYGFQMMLDLGETEETIAQKTGFSRTTVHHRLQIAKLNKKTLEKQAEDNEFQLTITDLMELEKVERIEDRNHLLRTAHDSRDLRYKISLHVEKARRKKNREIIIKKLEEMDVHEMSDGQYSQRYGSRWEQLEAISLEEDPPEKIQIKGMEDPNKTFYAPPSEYDSRIYIWKRAPKEKEREKTEFEKRREEQEKKRKDLLALYLQVRKERKLFIQGIIAGLYGQPEKKETVLEDLIEAAIMLNVRMYEENIGEWITNKRSYLQTPEQREEVKEKNSKYNSLHRILILTDYSANERELISWDCKWYEDIGKALALYHKILEDNWGFRVDDEELRMVLDGTHRNYVQEKRV